MVTVDEKNVQTMTRYLQRSTSILIRMYIVTFQRKIYQDYLLLGRKSILPFQIPDSIFGGPREWCKPKPVEINK